MIILLGLPKTGTTSFHHLFLTLGFKSYHQAYKHNSIANLIKDNIKKGKKLLDFIPEHERDETCLTQMDHCLSPDCCFWPQVVCYKELYHQNKDSIFILNKRNVRNVLKSFKKQMFPKKKKQTPLDKRLIKYNPELLADIPESDNPDERLLHFFENHNNNIINFFADKKDAKFIIYNIEIDSIDKLKEHIDIKDAKKLPRLTGHDPLWWHKPKRTKA